VVAPNRIRRSADVHRKARPWDRPLAAGDHVVAIATVTVDPNRAIASAAEDSPATRERDDRFAAEGLVRSGAAGQMNAIAATSQLAYSSWSL
jgi:hypothetical protein